MKSFKNVLFGVIFLLLVVILTPCTTMASGFSGNFDVEGGTFVEDIHNSEQPDTEQPATEQPSSEQPDTEQPATEQPSSEQPATEQPSSEQPDTEQPTTEQPSSEQPVTNQSTTEQSGDESYQNDLFTYYDSSQNDTIPVITSSIGKISSAGKIRKDVTDVTDPKIIKDAPTESASSDKADRSRNQYGLLLLVMTFMLILLIVGLLTGRYHVVVVTNTPDMEDPELEVYLRTWNVCSAAWKLLELQESAPCAEIRIIHIFRHSGYRLVYGISNGIEHSEYMNATEEIVCSTILGWNSATVHTDEILSLVDIDGIQIDALI